MIRIPMPPKSATTTEIASVAVVFQLNKDHTSSAKPERPKNVNNNNLTSGKTSLS
jgi:hypothetical protein